MSDFPTPKLEDNFGKTITLDGTFIHDKTTKNDVFYLEISLPDSTVGIISIEDYRLLKYRERDMPLNRVSIEGKLEQRNNEKFLATLNDITNVKFSFDDLGCDIEFAAQKLSFGEMRLSEETSYGIAGTTISFVEVVYEYHIEKQNGYKTNRLEDIPHLELEQPLLIVGVVRQLSFAYMNSDIQFQVFPDAQLEAEFAPVILVDDAKFNCLMNLIEPLFPDGYDFRITAYAKVASFIYEGKKHLRLYEIKNFSLEKYYEIKAI